MHVHEPAPLRSWQIAFEPHGDGLHGSAGISGTTTTVEEEEGSEI